MNFFENFGKKNKPKEENKTEKIMQERAKIRQTMIENLQKIGFNENEISEVTSILDKCAQDVQEQKDLLIGSNINNEYTVEIMDATFEIIRCIELKAASDIKAKITEIRQRKNNS